MNRTKKKVKKTIKPAVEELEKVKESAKAQVTGKYKQDKSNQDVSVIAEAMMQKSDGELSEEERKKRQEEVRVRAEKLEKEIVEERKKRQKKDKERVESQEIESKPGEPLEVPASKPKRGMPKMDKSKQKSPERRKSRH